MTPRVLHRVGDDGGAVRDVGTAAGREVAAVVSEQLLVVESLIRV